MIGSIIGGLVMAFLNNGLQLIGAGADSVSITKGLVLLLAVAVDVISKRRGGPSIIGLLTRRRDRAAVVVTEVPAVIPTSGTNESSQPADLPKR